MIDVSKASKTELDRFETVSWREFDREVFGKRVKWDEKKFTFKAAENNKILGLIYGQYEGGVAHIESLIVDKSRRGQGIGQLLLEKVESFTRERGGHKMILETGQGWKAEKFYQTHGFEKTHVLKNHYLHHDFILYEKFLS